MKPFFRAVLMSLRYKWSILGAVLCAVMISALWSFSISAILPVVQVVLNGDTFHDWIDNEIENSISAIDELEKETANFRTDIANASIDEDERHRMQLRLDISNDRLESENSLLVRYKTKLKPVITKWAPDDPFKTLATAITITINARTK